MRKIMTLLVFCSMLSACSKAETFETLGQIQHQQTLAPALATVQLSLPDSAAAQTFGSGMEGMYDCDGYTVLVQTFSSGDFTSTVQNLSGFSPDKLTVMESSVADVKRYDWVWTAAGEEGDMLCRASVLDDGNYHYCLCTVAPADQAGALSAEWSRLFGSFRLEQ